VASRLLAQLASRIAAARDPVEAACLRAQRGIYLARQGKYEHAQATVDAIRSEFGARPAAAGASFSADRLLAVGGPSSCRGKD